MIRRARLTLVYCAISIGIALANPAWGCDEINSYSRNEAEFIEFTGTVFADGRALAGVEVRCAYAGHRNMTKIGPATTTDQDGKFRVKTIKKRIKLIAAYPEYARTVSDWIAYEEVAYSIVELDLKRGVRHVRKQTLTPGI